MAEPALCFYVSEHLSPDLSPCVKLVGHTGLHMHYLQRGRTLDFFNDRGEHALHADLDRGAPPVTMPEAAALLEYLDAMAHYRAAKLDPKGT